MIQIKISVNIIFLIICTTEMPYQRKRGAKKVKKSTGLKNLANKMKTIALKQCETKVASDTAENLQLTHNGTYFKNNFFFTSQGTADPQGLDSAPRSRIGDEIIARGIKFKWWLSNKGDRPNVMYHIYVFYYNTLETPTVSTFWRGTDGVGGTMNRMLDNPNPDRVKVLKKLIVNSKSQYLGVQTTDNASFDREHSQLRELYISLNNKKIVYRRDSSGVPKGWDLGFAVVPYDSYGTLITDNIASFAWSSTFYFKDP
jgi:hypothetical protein